MRVRVSSVLIIALLASDISRPQAGEKCRVAIKSPGDRATVGRDGEVEGTATLPPAAQLLLFRKRHEAKTWSIVGTIVCKGSPCSWKREVDYGAEARTIDIAVVATVSPPQYGDVANIPKLPLGCKSEVTVVRR